MSFTQSSRMPRKPPLPSSASAPAMMLPRPCVSVMKPSERLDTQRTGLPAALAAIINAQYSGYAGVRCPKPPPTSCATKFSLSSVTPVYTDMCLRSVVTPCMHMWKV